MCDSTLSHMCITAARRALPSLARLAQARRDAALERVPPRELGAGVGLGEDLLEAQPARAPPLREDGRARREAPGRSSITFLPIPEEELSPTVLWNQSHTV